MIYDSNIEGFVDYYYSDIVGSYDDEDDQEYEEYDTIPPHESFLGKRRLSRMITPKSSENEEMPMQNGISQIQSANQADYDH
jgi:hypothetical protein